MNKITADARTLSQQAIDTGKQYMREAIDEIDKHLGSGAAERCPQIVAAAIAAMAQEMSTAIQAAVRQDAIESLSYHLDRLDDRLNELINVLHEIAQDSNRGSE